MQEETERNEGGPIPSRELSFEDIMAAEDIAQGIERFSVPEWGGHIYLRPLSAADVMKFNREMKTRSRDEAMIALFIKAACTARGVLLIQDAKLQIPRLQEKSTAPFVRAQTKIMQMSGMLSSSKTFEELQPLLEKHGVDPLIIRRIQTEWTEGDSEVGPGKP
jgi:hypothetical protein